MVLQEFEYLLRRVGESYAKFITDLLTRIGNIPNINTSRLLELGDNDCSESFLMIQIIFRKRGVETFDNRFPAIQKQGCGKSDFVISSPDISIKSGSMRSISANLAVYQDFPSHSKIVD